MKKIAPSFERVVEKYMQKAWNRRWFILALSGIYWAFFITVFIMGVVGGNSPLVSISGLAISLYVWLAGLTIYTAVDIRQRHDQLISLTDQSRTTHQALLKNIRLVSHYALIVTLSYTFWLGMFPDAKIWVAAFVILSGVLLLILLSHLLGRDKTKPLKALRVLVFCYLILAIKIALGMGLFPNFAEDMRNEFIPRLRTKTSAWMIGWVTPKKDQNKSPTCDPGNTPPPKNPPLPPKGDTGGTSALGSNHDTGGSGDGKKQNNLKPYLNERRAKLHADFPDLFHDLIAVPANLPAEQTAPIVAPPNTGETITPFGLPRGEAGLPPIKQLP